MKNFVKIFLLSALTLIPFLHSMGQHLSNSREIRDWYLEERFLITDSNDDALLDRTELAKFSDEFSYYLVEEHFTVSDYNKDRHLSFNEIRNRVHSEMMYRASTERRALRKLKQTYSIPSNPSVNFFMQRPNLVADLFGNLTWMLENSEMVKDILSNTQWVQEHEEVSIVLQKNLRWMVSHPTEAERLYNQRSTTELLPELLSWRADHKIFIRQNQMLDRAYLVDFFSRN